MSHPLVLQVLVAEIGITLRNARVQRGLTVDQVAQETRISPRFLEALEAEAFDELPAPVYVRGFLRSYANFLHLDATPLLDKLAANSSTPIVGPDGFVGGPSTTAGQTSRAAARRPSTDPFQRTPPQRPEAVYEPLRSRGCPSRSTSRRAAIMPTKWTTVGLQRQVCSAPRRTSGHGGTWAAWMRTTRLIHTRTSGHASVRVVSPEF
jgi:transcriptional regulator with XRE-family HTH domain